MDRLMKILNNIKPDIDFITNNKLVDDGLLDSLDIFSIIVEIEDEYKINIDPNDIDPDNFQSAITILEMIEKMK